MKSLIIGCFGLFIVFLLTSCESAFSSSNKAKPRALGKMNEIVVIADDELWEGPLGDSLDYTFAGPYPVIPRPEPIFDLRQFSTRELMNESLRRQLRTYLIVADLSDTSSVTTKMVKDDLGPERISDALEDPNHNLVIGKDKWAIGQILIYLTGSSKQVLAHKIRDNFNTISNRILEHDLIQLEASSFSKGENLGLSRKISEKHNLQIRIPIDFKVAEEYEDDDFTWLRKDLKDGTVSIVFMKQRYINQSQLTKEFVKSWRDSYGRKYVSSSEPNTYMITNDVDLPMFEYPIEIDGLYAKEYRGIWEMENDFMGGPFVSYLIVNEAFGELLLIDGFIYRPGKTKRNFMQQIDFIAKSAKAIN